jgi:hypothetical protein
MAFAVVTASVYAKPPAIKGSGVLKQETRDVTPFTRVVISDAMELILTQGAAESVKVEAEDNILPLVVVESGGEKLNIKFKESHNVQSTKQVKVYVTYKQLSEVFVSGASKLSATNVIQEEKFLLILSGASQATLNINNPWLSVNCSGASKAILRGTTEKLNVQCAGASNVNAQKLVAQEAAVEADGASSVVLDTRNKLNIIASGASVVRYLSAAGTSITKNISGASTAVPFKEDKSVE